MMTDDSSAQPPIECLNCGYEAPPGPGAWEMVDHPALDKVERCPECGSRNTTGLSRK